MLYVCMAVEARAPYVAYLQRHIPDLVVSWDRAGSAWNNWRFVLDVVRDGGIVLEDDVLLTRDFTAKAEAAVAEHPADLIQFFSMRGADLTVGSRWDRQLAMNQCLYYPPGLSERFAEWVDGRDYLAMPGAIAPYDIAICDALRAWRRRYWLHVPNLVDHAPLRSVIDPRRPGGRRSKTFADPELAGWPA